VFVVKKGKLFTPSVETVLEGVTRDTICHIAKDLKIEILERRITRDELYNADEVFLSGTAAEITPVSEVDMRKIGTGKPGEMTGEIQKKFLDIIHGKNPKYQSWVTVV
ncbi:MAG: branched chain amino acid aminotransferase, partial [Bacteriovoracaceae bacterium]|nr:branched chain amino acid aminotransferase [Bacteriovoracaceae bacterium]